jgi:hypothetical protein
MSTLVLGLDGSILARDIELTIARSNEELIPSPLRPCCGILRAMLFLALIVCCGELSAQNASYVGAETCGKCHAAQLAGQSASAHAHALSGAAQHPLAASFVPAQELVRPPRFHFQFRRSGAELRVGVSDGKETLDLPMEWAFGAGEQAVTFVSRLDADWYLEHYFTYYSAIRALAPTPGHEGYRSNTLPLARGVLYQSVDPVSGIVKCFECRVPWSSGTGQEAHSESGTDVCI